MPCVRGRRDAAALACCCVDAAAAAPASKWHNAVRVGPGGAVQEPASGAFDVVIAVGESVQAGVDHCPRGGSVLLLPGKHFGPLVLAVNKEVHIFGRGLASLLTSAGDVIRSAASQATIDGLTLQRIASDEEQQQEAESGERVGDAVHVSQGRLRLQSCDIRAPDHGVFLTGGSDVVIIGCRCASGLVG